MIITHPTHFVAATKQRAFVVQCDVCRTMAQRTGEDAGDAAEEARKCGFGTKRTGLGAPMKWLCLKCRES